ncbi:hypothetical protein N7474_006005 [Penicillium riverlandense]|uniref:uncharacterized protein n=1 Tax=Penicillium riverlandense TaxID=1903569 RepID=UPI0025483306|nr:uncharacterized protein N7474_006005 [Penicillium riverlandense]KAJ5820414.1 hypothetical protein N7474_006005 [Penicillium riverlandense]
MTSEALPSNDWDAISLTSTISSEQCSTYEVETILAQRDLEDGPQFLVKWANYGSEANSWEPEDAFDSQETLLEWERKKRDIDQGRVPPFDVEAWEIHVQLLAEAGPSESASGIGNKRNFSATCSPLFVTPEPSRSPVPVTQVAQETVSSTVSSSSSDKPLVEERASRVSNVRPAAQLPTPKPPTAPPEKPPLAGFGIGNMRNKRVKPNSWDEPMPDVTQLELRKPSEFPARTGHKGSSSLQIGSSGRAPTASNTRNGTQVTAAPPVQPQPTPEGARAINTSTTTLSSPTTVFSPGRRHSRPDLDISPKPVEPRNRARPSRRLIDRIGPSRQREARDIHDSYRPGGLFRDLPPLLDSYRPQRDDGFRQSRSPSPRLERYDPRFPKPLSANGQAPSVEEQIQQMPVPSARRGANFFQQRGENYFRNPGEVLAQVYWGPDKKYVGPVRLCGASAYEDVTGQLMKNNRGLRLEVWFSGWKGPRQKECNVWAEGFPNTNRALVEMAEYLRERSRVAIYYPPTNEGYVWVAYSRWSHAFDILTHPMIKDVSKGAPLVFAVQRQLAPMERPLTRHREQQLPSFPRPNQPLWDRVSTRTTHGDSHSPGQPGSEEELRIRGAAQWTPIASSERGLVVKSQSAEETSSHQRRNAEIAGPEPSKRPTQPLDSRPRLPAVDFFGDHGHHAEAPPSKPSEHVQPVSDLQPQPEDSTMGEKSAQSSANEPDSLNKNQNPTAELSGIPLLSVDTRTRAQTPPANMSLSEIFKAEYNITMKDLATVQDSQRVAKFFYLWFPIHEDDSEYVRMAAFLEENGVTILSNRNAGDWSKFVHNIKGGSVAVFHESFSDYSSLKPSIRYALRNTSLNFWSACLKRPLEHPDGRYPTAGEHFQRLFPYGAAILVTPDVLLADVKGTAVLLKWFWYSQIQKPGISKLLFPPNILEWIKTILTKEDRDQTGDILWLTILAWIKKNNSVDRDLPRFWPTSLDTRYLDRPNNNVLSFPTYAYGTQFKDAQPSAPADEQCVNNLMETYAGWCLVHAARFRRFIIITSAPQQTRTDSWGHVEFFNLKAFYDTFKVDYQRLYQEIKGEVKQASAPSTSVTPNQGPLETTPKDI